MAKLSDVQLAAGNLKMCIHLQTLALTSEELDQLEIENLINDVGRDTPH